MSYLVLAGGILYALIFVMAGPGHFSADTARTARKVDTGLGATLGGVGAYNPYGPWREP